MRCAKYPAKLLPSPLDFDHAIVRAKVDGKIFYLDPTRLGQHGRLDRMGQAHEGAAVLVIAPDTKTLTIVQWSQFLKATTLPVCSELPFQRWRVRSPAASTLSGSPGRH